MDQHGTIFSFPDIKSNENRTRIIVFVTDNDLYGTETVSLDDACKLCKKYDISVYAYCPTTEMNRYATPEKISSYKNAIENYADGKFYTGDLSKMSSLIVDEIKDTKTSLLKTAKKTYVTDYPTIPFIIILSVFIILNILEKRIKL